MWIENCIPELADKNIQVKDVRICQEHFENKMFLNVITKNRLTGIVIPTLFNGKKIFDGTRCHLSRFNGSWIRGTRVVEKRGSRPRPVQLTSHSRSPTPARGCP